MFEIRNDPISADPIFPFPTPSYYYHYYYHFPSATRGRPGASAGWRPRPHPFWLSSVQYSCLICMCIVLQLHFLIYIIAYSLFS